MDDETLVGSARSPQTSPYSASASTITSAGPRTSATVVTGNLVRGRRRPLRSLADVVAELGRANEHHIGSYFSPVFIVVGLGSVVLMRFCGFISDGGALGAGRT